MIRSGIAHLRRVQQRPELLLGGAVEATGGVDDLGATAVVECHVERDPLVGGGLLLHDAIWSSSSAATPRGGR